METHFLASLLAVAKYNSITEAARSQDLTPAAIRQRIKTLESEFQTSLFKRSGKKMMPTEQCIRLLPEAQNILLGTENLRASILDNSLSGEIKVGAIISSMPLFIASAMKRMNQVAPNTKIEIRPGTSKQLYEQLQNGEIDLAILIKPPFPLSKEYQIKLLQTEKLTLLTQKNTQGSIEEILKKSSYIQYDPTSWGGVRADAFLKDKEINPNIFCTLDAPAVIPLYIDWGLGVSLVPDWGDHWAKNLNVKKTVIKSTKYQRKIIAIYKVNTVRQRTISTFLTFINTGKPLVF